MARPIEVPMVFGARVYDASKLALRDQVEFLANIVQIRLHRSSQFFRYCTVGALGVSVNTGLLVALRRSGLRLEFASPVAVEASIAFNYFLNDLWTFRSRSPEGHPFVRFLRFHLAAGIAGVINFAVLLLLAQTFRVWYVAANLVGIVLASAVNSAVNSCWTWRRRAEGSSASSPRGSAAEGSPSCQP